MSQENVEVVQRMLDHFSATLELLEELFAPGWVLDLTHATRVPDHLPRYEGNAGWRSFFSLWIEQFDEMSYEWQAYREVDDRVVVIGRQHAVAKVSRAPVEQALGLVCTLQDRLITRIEIFNGAADEALKAVGLAE